ncbi:MAG: hypothetical protein K2O52_00430, partial [Oscillospiraceae bacterium]|nr:hypothetical protein [Oscillospiraceae bacterium]
MKAKKHGSIFAGLLVVVLFMIVAGTIFSNLIFSGERVPKIAGYYLHLQDSNEMEPDIPEKSLVFAKSLEISEELQEGNKVLCYLVDGTLVVRNIYKIEQTEDGVINYYPGTSQEQGVDYVIPRTNIFAICTWTSAELYQYVNFATSVAGLMALLVVPCVILIIMLLVKIAKNGNDDMEDEQFMFKETELTPKKKKKVASQHPLYNPDDVPAPDSLEKKKSTISENFSAKPVNENSPYQKAVQEREKTMKFRRQEIEEEALKVFDEPRPKKKQQTNTQVYSTEEIKAKAQEMQQSEPVIKSKPEPVAPKPSVQKPEPVAKSVSKPAPKPVYKSTSPNIDDILNPPNQVSKTSFDADSKKGSDISSTDSIDDLIKILE